MTVFAGVDLAWSGRKPSGLCVLRLEAGGLAFVSLECATLTAHEVASWLGSLGPDVVAGIDATLVVSARRTAEAAMARVYGSRGVCAYAARPDFLERRGIGEGPRLGSALGDRGWNADPARPMVAGRHALEVFPHAAIVALFGAPRALRYKKGPLASRLDPLREYRDRISTHVAAECPALADSPLGGLLHAPITPQPGRTLKDIEDRLDAVTCALSAYHMWRHGAAGTTVFGDASSGYIAVPVALERS